MLAAMLLFQVQKNQQKLLSLVRLKPLLRLDNYHLHELELLEQCLVMLQLFAVDMMALDLLLILILVFIIKSHDGAKVIL